MLQGWFLVSNCSVSFSLAGFRICFEPEWLEWADDKDIEEVRRFCVCERNWASADFNHEPFLWKSPEMKRNRTICYKMT